MITFYTAQWIKGLNSSDIRRNYESLFITNTVNEATPVRAWSCHLPSSINQDRVCCHLFIFLSKTKVQNVQKERKEKKRNQNHKSAKLTYIYIYIYIYLFIYIGKRKGTRMVEFWMAWPWDMIPPSQSTFCNIFFLGYSIVLFPRDHCLPLYHFSREIK
jgi:hypothetical protein